MAKNTRGKKELSKTQELKHEGRELRIYIRDLEARNRELEKDNTALRRKFAGSRKDFARMDLDRHSYVQEIIQEHLTEEQESIDSTALLSKMKSKWLCRDCHTGHLEIFVYSRMGQPYYFRQCSECPNRTRAQPHHPNVEGIVKPPAEEPIKIGAVKKSHKKR